ncbi:MAG: GIY-YIG nuclease family protein [Gammaproteobacteria bacterium]
MKFAEVIRALLKENPAGLTPQEIRDLIKSKYPDYYGTESHRKNVEKGHYKDIDHALLAQIYVFRQNATDIYADTSQKPMRLSLSPSTILESDVDEDLIETENLSKLEAGIGTLYVLGTNLYTKAGEEIIKIGITTGTVERRIDQLFNTSAPYRFRAIRTYEAEKYAELEQAVHRMLDPFRINQSREYFTDKCLPFVETLIATHEAILAAAVNSNAKEKSL